MMRSLKLNLSGRMAIYSVLLMCVYIFIAVDAIAADRASEDKNPSPFGVDFAVYYTAGKMTTSGAANLIYNVPKHHTVLEEVLQRKTPFLLPWVYPPTFLLAIIPLSYLPYYVALAWWLIITFGLAFYAMYLLVPSRPALAFLFCGFPGVVMNLRWGQNGFLTTALIGFGLYFVERKPIMAGLMFGLLAYKPQIAFFPIILLLLLKKWRILLWTLFFTLFTAVSSGILLGFDIWRSFIHSMLNSSTILLDTQWLHLAPVQPSLYTTLRLMGVSSFFCYVATGVVGCIVLIVVRWIWRKTNRLPLKGAALVVGMLLVIPYFIQYDLVILSIPLILLVFDCMENGYRRYELLFLYGLALLPLINYPVVELTNVQICPFVLAVILGMIFIRTTRVESLG